MTLNLLWKVLALLVLGACTACSSAGQSVETQIEARENMATTWLNAGIKTPPDTDAMPQSVVTFYVSNTASTEVQVLIWNTPLENPLSADVFLVTKAGEPVPYTGRKVKRGKPLPEHYITLAAGETREVLVDIARYHDVTSPGPYSVTLKFPEIDGVSQLNQMTSARVDPHALTFTIAD